MRLEELVRRRLLQLRKSRYLRQLEFAQAIGVPFKVLSNLERGVTPWTLDRVEQVCFVFNLAPRELIMEEAEAAAEQSLTRLVEALAPAQQQALAELLAAVNPVDAETIRLLAHLFRRLRPVD